MPCKISTHTSRVGCDGNTWRLRRSHRISTHTSRVGCDAIALFNAVDASFLLTHPVWDVTHIEEKIQLDVLISTHTSRVGCDTNLLRHVFLASNFYSHIPCGMWQETTEKYESLRKISTHTSRVGCDIPDRRNGRVGNYFYSHIPCGMWPKSTAATTAAKNFYSHIPCGMWLSFAQITILPSPFLLTHPVWDVTDDDSSSADPQTISTHTSRVGCDYHLHR